MDDLNKLQTFVLVADGRSFTRAAQRLHVTTSAVSKQIAELEGGLGVRLFNRSTRGVSLTEAGNALFGRCSRVLGELSEAMAAAQGQQSEPQGTLKVHATFGFGQWVLAPLLPKFMARHPRLQVEVTSSTPALSLVEAGADVVVSGKTSPDSGLAYSDLGPVPYVICATPDYFAKHGKPARPADLARHNCLRHTIFSPGGWPFSVPKRNSLVKVSGNFFSSSSEVLLQVALQGTGIVRLPYYTVKDQIEAGQLVPILEDVTRTIQHTRVYYPQGARLPAKTTAFVDFLVEELAPATARRRRGRAAA